MERHLKFPFSKSDINGQSLVMIGWEILYILFGSIVLFVFKMYEIV